MTNADTKTDGAARHAAHLEAMAARAAAARAAKAAVAANGVGRRNSHNERLANQRAERLAYRESIKIGGAT